VGKQTILGIVTVAVMGVIAFRADVTAIPLLACLAVGVVALIVLANLWYAHHHPAEAMFDGTEMLAFQHQMMAAKSLNPPKEAPVVPNPDGEPPQLNPPDIDAEQP
jgi:hypothetical protein